MVGPSDDHDNLIQHVLLTINAIIQAVAFSELVRVCHLFVLPDTLSLSAWARPLQAIATLQVIVITWHEYVIMNLGFEMPARAFGLTESYLAFALGAAEVGVVSTVEDGHAAAWCAWMAAFFFVALWAYLSMYRKVIKVGETTIPSRVPPALGCSEPLIALTRRFSPASASAFGICYEPQALAKSAPFFLLSIWGGAPCSSGPTECGGR
jgi:hypothetical protein